MHNSTYTFILHFEGGIHLSQLQARSIGEAMSTWGERLDVGAVEQLHESIKSGFIEDIRAGEESALLDGLVNFWTFVVESHERFGHVYFAKTAEMQPQRDVGDKESRYTFFMSFADGEYASQVYGSSPHEAIIAWGENLAIGEIEHLDERLKRAFQAELGKVFLNKAPGLEAVWSFSISPSGRLARVTVIETSDECE